MPPDKVQKAGARVVALAGNPNVGKSTVFNALTGLRQHTGNWPGKTVVNARGTYEHKGINYELVDLPGSYSLMSRSADEEAARDFICFGEPEAVAIVCDAGCLERNLILALQALEAAPRGLLCVNLMDEAKKRGVEVDIEKLSSLLGVPVVAAAARSGYGLSEFTGALAALCAGEPREPYRISYSERVERAIRRLSPSVAALSQGRLDTRWLCARLLDGDESFLRSLELFLGFRIEEAETVAAELALIRAQLGEVRDEMAAAFVKQAESISRTVVREPQRGGDGRDRRLDMLFASRATGFPIMLLLLLGVFWLTITGANYPSQLLSRLLFSLEDSLAQGAAALGLSGAFSDALIHGAYRVMAWVVSVMLPPMAIFFPLFTLLEDFGYLPRVAFNLDRGFKNCGACGKQALTMCMGFGCNAAGVTGCRIIDSPREKLIAILTNCFVPCNGRFPIIIALISAFILTGRGSSLLGAASLVIVVVLGVGVTMLVSKLLSLTLLRGLPSSFTLELPPYRRPQFGKVIVRSVLDRTLKVLARAVAAAAPAGLLIWVMANVSLGGATLLSHLTGALEPLGRFMGLDGAILVGFLLGLPANEIVIPVILMTYTSQGALESLETAQIMSVFVDNGWTLKTALCVIVFTLMHWPCATTIATIKKETGSLLWTAASIAIPSLCGFFCCALIEGLSRIL